MHFSFNAIYPIQSQRLVSDAKFDYG